MLIIYRVDDGVVVSNSGTNSYLPNGPSFEEELQNVIPVFGGSSDDYGEFRLHDENDKEIVHDILHAGSYQLVFDENKNPVGVTVYPRAQVAISPEQPFAGQEVLVTASVPTETVATEMEFYVDGMDAPIPRPIVNGEASHVFVFSEAGNYVIHVQSEVHGETSLEVTVVDEGSH